MTDMLVGYIQRVLDSLILDPVDEGDNEGDALELPPPMLKVGGGLFAGDLQGRGYTIKHDRSPG
jgi:hypothetical protein